MPRKTNPPAFRDRIKDFRRVDTSELVPSGAVAHGAK
jgi:hypothetical protein